MSHERVACASEEFLSETRLSSSLQPQNILLTGVNPLGDIKIVDFGLARRLGSIGELREIVGTPEYVGMSYVTSPSHPHDAHSSSSLYSSKEVHLFSSVRVV